MFGIDMDPERLIGFDCETAAHSAKSLFKEEDEFINFLNATLIKKNPVYGKEFNLKDGRVFSIDFISMKLNDNFIGTLWKYSDITSRKKNEQLLIDDKNHAEEMAKAKQLFLANMSHEIRTPMNAIMGLSGLLENSELNDEQLKYTKAIKKASENLLVVINDILDISKMDVEKLKIELEAFDFKEFIHQIKDLLIFKIKEKGLEFDVQVSKNVPHFLITDHFRLNQILINIIGNAIKFTNRGGISMHVDAQPIDDKSAEIIFQITDTGIGIEEENLKKIFEVFSQEYANTAKKFGGTGLGLSISNKLSILLGGSLQLNSRKNHGSTVTINIPMQITTVDEVEKLNINIDEIDISGKRVLIVEDYEFNRLLANRLMSNFKCIPSEAKNGLEALMKIVSMDYDVILMDIQMPVMNGYEALELIRSFKIKAPVIALTANASGEEKEKCLQMGFDDYLTKPFKPEDLKIAISKVTASEFKKPSVEIQPIFSLDYLDEIANHNEFFKLKTLRILTDELLKSIAEISDAVKQEDIIKLKFIIHKISPTLKSLKIIRLESSLQFLMSLNNEVKFNEEIKNSSIFIQIVLNHIAFEIVEKYLKTNEKLN
jgi:signal transduction histidine kinase/DNA-binding response OmpR family regulator